MALAAVVDPGCFKCEVQIRDGGEEGLALAAPLPLSINRTSQGTVLDVFLRCQNSSLSLDS